MKETTKAVFDELFVRYPSLLSEKDNIMDAFNALLDAYREGGKILVCGNGGSAADAEHLCGELLKSFKKRREIPSSIAMKIRPELAAKLEGALPAISLVSMTGLLSAFANDVSWESAFAQQVLSLGDERDVLVAFSTSGNSANCVAAAEVMKAKGGKVVALTGFAESKLSRIADVAIRVGEKETFKVQELHLPVYHALAAAIEEELF
jgi:phosphoheptose isomerase